MKKSVAALLILVLVITYLAFFQIKKIDVTVFSGYASNVSQSTIASNLKTSKNSNITLTKINDSQNIYQRGNNYYVGEDKNNKIYLDVPVYNLDNTRIWNYLDNNYINESYYDTDTVSNIIVADKKLFSNLTNDNIDNESYLFSKLNSEIYINYQKITLALVNETIEIPEYSLIYFNKDYLNFYMRVNDELVYQSIPFIALTTGVKIGDNDLTYENLLTNLGLYNKEEENKNDDYKKDDDKPNYDKPNKDDDKDDDSSDDGYEIIIDDTKIIPNINGTPGNNNSNNANYVKPEVIFDGFTGRVYSATGNITINDPAMRIVTSPTFTLTLNGKTYLKKSFYANGEIELTGLLPNETYEVEAYYIFKNENDQSVKKTFYTGTFKTLDSSSLNEINISYRIDNIYSNKIVLNDFEITNDKDDEIFNGLKNIVAIINNEEYNFSVDQVNKIKLKKQVTYQTPENLESNKDYTGVIKMYDVAGTELKVLNNTFTTKTSKEAPTASIKLIDNDLTYFKVGISLTNKDKVNLSNYHYEIYTLDGTLETSGNLENKDYQEIRVNNLDSNKMYKIYIIANYDLEDGNGTLLNKTLAEATVSTKPISALGYVKFDLRQIDITRSSVKFEMNINKESTSEKLIELLDKIYITLKQNDKVIKTVEITGDDITSLKDSGKYNLEFLGLESNTEYTLSFSTIERQVDKTYEIDAISNITNFKTYRTPAYAVVSNQFTNESIIDFDVRVVDNDFAIQSDRVLIRIHDAKGNYVLLKSIAINGSDERISLNKLDNNMDYDIEIIAEGYNEGYTNRTYESNHVLEGSRTLTTKLGVSASIRIENLLSVVTSNNIFNINYTDNFRFSGSSGLNKISTDVDNKVISFSAMNGTAYYSYYMPEYKNSPIIVKFKAKQAEGSNGMAAYLTSGVDSNQNVALNLTNEYKDYRIELVPDNGYVGFRVDETSGKNTTTTIDVKDLQFIPYLNYATLTTQEMSIYDRNYVFYDTKILTGNDEITEPDGKTSTGHVGDGYARITNLLTNETRNFNYTGSVSSFTVPNDGNYLIETWGASGGDNYNNQTLTGNSHAGRGGYSKGTIKLTKDTTLYVVVGGRGKYGPRYIAGGFNGGGSGALNSSGSGGGATDVRLVYGTTDETSLKSRIMVAGGGGGTDDDNNHCLENCTLSNDGSGGAGGGIYTDGAYMDGILHTRFSAGQLPVTTKDFNGNIINQSQLGIGENATGNDSGGGGGGYYGGMATKYNNGGGAGGSSYISGHVGCISINYKDNLTKNEDYSDYNENYDYTGQFYISVTDHNFENTGSPEIPNDDFYVQIVKKDNEIIGMYHYNLDDNEIIDHKVEDMLVAYNFNKGTEYTINILVLINNRYYTINSLNFKTDDQIRTIRTKEEFYNMSSTGNFLISNDIDLRYSNRTIGGTFNGNVDFQGHKLLLNVKNSSSRVFAGLGKGAVIKNLDLHIWYDEARNRYDTLTDWSSATISNVMITIEEAVTTPSSEVSFLVRVNRGTVDHFIVHNKAEIHTTRYFGFISNYIYGTVKNGYLYGEKINGNHDSGLKENKYIGAIGAYMSEAGYIENVYSLIEVIGFSDFEKPQQMNVGSLVGVISRGTINNSYTYDELQSRNTNLDSASGSIDQLNAKNLYYVSPLTYTNSKSKKLSKVALTSVEFQNQTLNGENAFLVDDYVKYGFFPQLNMNESMPKQDYIKLPEVTDADLLNILTSNVVSQTGNEAIVDILVRNPTYEQVKKIEVQYFTSNIMSQNDNEDGTSLVRIKLTNPSRYISSYSINSITSLSKVGIEYTRKFDAGTLILDISMYREINNEKEWLNMASNSGDNFRLMTDLDFSSYTNAIITRTITGKIDGNNHTIKNMKTNTSDGIAFYVMQGTLSNITFENIVKTNYATCSGLIGYLQSSGTMDNVHVKNVKIKLGQYSGGLAGLARYSSNIRNSSVSNLSLTDTINVTAMRVGGLVGQTENSNIMNSFAQNINLDVTSSSQLYAVGGIVGYNSYGIISQVYSTGYINSNYPNTGGIAGINYGRVEEVISAVRLISAQIYAGGIVGNEFNNNVSDTLFVGELYSSLENEIHRTIGNTNLSNRNFYAWAGQKINGVVSNNSAGETLLSTEELTNPDSYATKITLGSGFYYDDVVNGSIPKLYYKDSTELLPNQEDTFLDIIDDEPLIVDSINVEKDLTSADVSIVVKNNDVNRYKITGIKIEDVEEINPDDIRIYNENSGLDYASFIRVTIKPKYYLDSYRISKIYYTDNGTAKELDADSKIDVTFFRSINSIDDFQSINTNYTENYSINANLDFSNIDNSIIKRNILANKVEGNGYTISGYNLTLNTSGIYMFKEVRTYIKDLTFKDINMTYSGSGGVTGLAIIGTAYGNVSNITLNNITLNGNLKVNRVGFIANSYVNDYKDINISNVTISGTHRLGSLYGEGDTYYLSGVTMKSVNVSGTSDFVGGLIGYKHYDDAARHYYITADDVHVSTTGGTYSGIIYGYGAASNVTITNSSVSGNNQVGGVGGNQDTGGTSTLYLTNVSVTGKGSQIGGIYGYHRSVGNSYIKDSTISGGSEQVGGIGGYGSYSIYSSAVINTTINSPNANYVGGIEGLNWDGSRYNNTIYNTEIVGKNYVGGVVGYKNGTSTGYYYGNLVNATITAKGVGGAGILGYYANSIEEENVRRVNIYDNIVANSIIAANSEAGGLIGKIDKSTDTNLNLFRDNILAVKVNATGTNKVAGILSGSSDLYLSGAKRIHIYDQSRLNNINIKNAASLGSATIDYLTASDLKDKSKIQELLNKSSSYFNSDPITSGYYPRNTSALSTSYLVTLPSGEIKNMRLRLMSMNINLPESYVYPSSINTINIDFDTINTAKIEINNQTYDIDNYTMSFYYDYKSDFTYKIKNGRRTKEVTIKAADLRRTITTKDDNYYYLKDGKVISNLNTINGNYIHIFNNEALDTEGNIYNLNTNTTRYISIKNLEPTKDVVSLVTYDYQKSKIKTFYNYSLIDNKKIDNQTFIKNINIGMISSNLDNQKDMVIVDYYNNLKVLLTLSNGKLVSLMNDIKLPDDFKNQDIKELSSNINNDTNILMVRYNDNKVYAFDYKVGKKIDIVDQEEEEKVSLVDFFKTYINDTNSNKALESYEEEYLESSKFIKNIESDKVISYNGYYTNVDTDNIKDTTNINELVDNYAVSYNPLKQEYEVYNIPYLVSKNTSSIDVNTSVNDVLNKSSSMSNSMIVKYKGKVSEHEVKAQYLIIIIIASISVALAILAVILRRIYTSRKNESR